MSSNEPMYFRRARLMRMQDKLSMAMLYLIGAGTLGAVGLYLYALKTKQITREKPALPAARDASGKPIPFYELPSGSLFKSKESDAASSSTSSTPPSASSSDK